LFLFCCWFHRVRHMCMLMRGVEKAGSSTVTSTLLGVFESDKDIRKEFFALVNAPARC
jgi:GTP cyclohydrolase I